MTEEAIQDHLDDGWLGIHPVTSSDPRHQYITHGDLDGDGDVEIIWQKHDIPAE